MTSEPLVKPLSERSRVFIFRVLAFVFALAMPLFVFYATGYRIDLGAARNIITVGGLYISADAQNIRIVVDDEPIYNMRLFQNAAYVQNVAAGMHEVRVEREGLRTWVKELPVYPHIVTEAHALNMPVVPQIRFVPRWLTATGLPVLIRPAGTPDPFLHASTTNTVIATTSQSLRGYTENSEHEYLESLFASSSERAPERAVDVFRQNFMFNGDVALDPAATTTKISRDVRLSEDDGEIYAEWIGPSGDIPYYYCVTHTSATSTSALYGAHVYEDLVDEFGSDRLESAELQGARLCRDTIRIDRMRQDVYWFDFLPGTSHHVLMLLETGLYATEVDDRSWQNVQLLYPGTNLEVIVDGGQIYIFDGTYYFELLTEIPT